MDINTLREQINQDKLPPVAQWQPELSGEMDLVIEREGQWRHEGVVIERLALRQLFSKILRYESNQYYLVTPVEKWQIKVQCLPFYIVSVDRYFVRFDELDDRTIAQNSHEPDASSYQVIVFTDSLGYQTELNHHHPLAMVEEINCSENNKRSPSLIPTVLIRDNLSALLSRTVYYQLIEWAMESQSDDDESMNELMIDSSQHQFSLGAF